MAEQNKININYLNTLALQESETDTIQEIDSNLYNSISGLIKNLKSESYDGVNEKILSDSSISLDSFPSILITLNFIIISFLPLSFLLFELEELFY